MAKHALHQNAIEISSERRTRRQLTISLLLSANENRKALDTVPLVARLSYYWHNDILHDRADMLRFNIVLSHRAAGKLISRADRIAFYYLCKFFPLDILPCIPLHALSVSTSLSPFSISVGGNTGREWDWSMTYTIGLAAMLPKLYNLVEGRISHRLDGINISSGLWIFVIIIIVGHTLGCLFFALGAHHYVAARGGRFGGTLCRDIVFTTAMLCNTLSIGFVWWHLQ